MPITNGTYVSPTWNNNAPPAIDATELQAITDTTATVPSLVRPNLLDNWFFCDSGSQASGSHLPINQRGETYYDSDTESYTIDRWKKSANATVNISNVGVDLYSNDSQIAVLSQPLRIFPVIRGEPVTLSVLVTSSNTNTFYTASSKIPTSAPSAGTSYCVISDVAQLTHVGGGLFEVRLLASMSGTSFCAVKLEIGTTQTLAHGDTVNSNKFYPYVLNEVPDYEEQVFRCQTATADSSDTYANQKNIVGTYSTIDLTAGTSALPTGAFYFVYE